MTVNDLVVALDAEVAIAFDLSREIKGFYASDYLSNAIVKAPMCGAWFTVMNNVDVAGIAVLNDLAVIVLCEGIIPDIALEARAEERGINIIVTKKSIFEACVAVKQ